MHIWIIEPQWVNSLWPSDTIRRQRSGSTLVQVMAWCLMVPHQYLWPSDTIRWQRSESTLAQVMAWCLMAPCQYLWPSDTIRWQRSESTLAQVMAWCLMAPRQYLWPSDTIRWQRSESTLAQVMAWCHLAPSHYLNQCWLSIIEDWWHSPEAIKYCRKSSNYLSLIWVSKLLIEDYCHIYEGAVCKSLYIWENLAYNLINMLS